MRISKVTALVICSAITAMGTGQLRADDTEVFFSSGSTTVVANPNLLLILDTSGSMGIEEAVTPPQYDPKNDYTGSSGCAKNDVYFAAAGTTPKCTDAHIAYSDFYCSPAKNTGVHFDLLGKYADKAVRWSSTTTTPKKGSPTTAYNWTNTLTPISGTTLYNQITCASDDTPSSDNKYPISGATSSSSGLWTNSSTNNYYTPSNNPGTTSYVFFLGNYIAYANDPSLATTATRASIVKTAAKNLIDSLSGKPINVGIMRYSANAGTTAQKASGGMVVAAAQDVTANATLLKNTIDAMHYSNATPLTETLYEAYLYYSGGNLLFGLNSKECDRDEVSADCGVSNSGVQKSLPSVDASRTVAGGSTYKSPITNVCQQNYIVYLTDGLPKGDDEADSAIEGLDSTGSCYGKGLTASAATTAMWKSILGSSYTSNPSDTSYDGTTGVCLKEMSRILQNKDMRPDSTLTGYIAKSERIQNVTTYFIGFGSSVAGGAALSYLQDAGKAGGGDAFGATSAYDLSDAFDRAIGGLLDTSSTFTSPSVAVNSFNKTQVLEDLYVGMFAPSETRHWPGNVKKYKLRNSMIVGRDPNSATAVDTVSAVSSATGFITDASKDFWQQLSDGRKGSDVTGGGAANMIPVEASRNVYTYIGSNAPGSGQALTSHLLALSNTNITASKLALTGASTEPTRDELINWVRGDDDGDLNKAAIARREMGDPIHSQPAVVIYGSSGSSSSSSSSGPSTAQLNDAAVFMATNDGFLHAIDVSTGTELWSYVPQELLSDMKNVYADATTTADKHYSLDGNLRVLRYDANNDGIIKKADNDRVFLYFSQGRGGDRYYALDVTEKTNPKFMWSLGAKDASGATDTTEFSGRVSKSWSTPALGRVKVGTGSGQNPQNLVLIFGAGHDNTENSQGYSSAGDATGNGIFMVDAVKGTILWYQTKAASGAFADMTHAIPSDVTVLDTNNDGFTDRMYVGDMAGQVWRFDITQGGTGGFAGNLVAGGVIASLGDQGGTNGDIVGNRRFYNAPDVSYFVMPDSSNFYNIALGSGNRVSPKTNIGTRDRFYSLRDYHIQPLTQSDYDSYTATTESGLTTIDGTTAKTIGSNGWKLNLSSTEKALARSTTVSGTVLFSTYIPTSSVNACTPTAGTAHTYAVDVLSGLKHFANLYETEVTTGLPTEVTIVDQSKIVRTDGTTSSSGSSSSSSSGNKSLCLTGVTVLGNCVQFGSKVKTFWQDTGAD